MEKTYISEDMNVQDEWYKEARALTTTEGLTIFLNKLMTNYSHDLNTVVHAMTAGSMAAISVMNHYPEGGITPAQAQKLLGLFIRKWAKIEGPAKLWSWAGLLHPGNEEQVLVVPAEVQTWLTVQASEMITKKSYSSETHRIHLQDITLGRLPWGFRGQV